MPDPSAPGPSAPEPIAPRPSASGPRRLAAAFTGIQALALLGFAAFYVYELVIGEGSDATRVLMSALLILVGGLGLAALTRGWLSDGAWPKTPTLVWSALLVPVGFGLVQGNQVVVGWTVLGLAVATGVSALRVPTPPETAPGVDPGA